jgi:hypothetical protein
VHRRDCAEPLSEGITEDVITALDAVEAGDRALARSPGRSNAMITHSFLAAAYAEMGRNQDAEGERAIITRLSPFFDARIFAAQFGTEEARNHLLEGLKKAGFH